MNIDQNQRIELLLLARDTYHTQAELCNGAGAPLAACIMVGASVEAVLTALTSIRYDDSVKTAKAPKRKKKITPLLDWSLSELLSVACELKWLPKELMLDERLLVGCTFKNPVRTDTIREVRNLVHPARYLQDRAGTEYTAEELRILYVTCHAVYEFVQKVLIEACRKVDPSYNPPSIQA